MSRTVRFRPAARRDVKRLAENFADAPPRIAEILILRLERAVLRLAVHPFIGRPLEHDDLRETLFAYGKIRYVIRYFVTDTDVVIVRVWHGKENRPH